jgi:dienelactone hydrolase
MRTRRSVLTFAALLALAGPASGEVKTKAIEYTQDGTILQGFFAWDDAKAGKRPGVLVIHEWWGHNEHARKQAMRLAEAGYVGFALDMFGKGKLATHPKDAQAFASELMAKPEVAAARFNAALAQLKQDPHVDPEKIAVFGYCFGGGVALAMARAGVDLDAVVTFHGALETKTPAKPGAVKPRLLVLTGGADPMQPAAAVEAFKAEMKAAGASFDVVSYPGVKHSFTNPGADKVGMEGLAYDAAADKASWAAAMKLLGEVFK